MGINLWPLGRRMRTKSSKVAPLIVAQQKQRSVGTPRRYDALAEEGYHKNVIVYRCVNVIARALASVPWLLFEANENKEQELISHPLLNLLKRPSPTQSGAAFIEECISYLLLSGNAYLESVTNELGVPIELYALRPDRVEVIPSNDGDVFGYAYTVGGAKHVLEQNGGKGNVLHMKLFHPLHDYYGLSPLEAAASSIDQHNAVGVHNVSLLHNGGRPTGALIIKEKNLHPEQRETLRQDLHDLYQGGSNAGKMMILEGNFEWKEMGLSPKDLDFSGGKSMSAREIAQAFGVPSILVGIMGDATYANYKEARLHLWEDTILPLLNRLTCELNAWLTPCFGDNLRLDYDIDTIPALTDKREMHWGKVVGADFLSVNEKRQEVGYPPIEGGDALPHCLQGVTEM